MIEDEKRKNEAGVAEADSIARAAKLELEANTSF